MVAGALNFPAHQCIVVGGGLAGFSAAHTVMEHGGRIVVLDKSPFCGGNSTKATSGINGAGTSTQKKKGIVDNGDIFLRDTLKGGAKKPEVAKVTAAEIPACSTAHVDSQISHYSDQYCSIPQSSQFGRCENPFARPSLCFISDPLAPDY